MGLGEPRGLAVVLGGDGEGVEEDQEEDGPVEGDGFHRPAAAPAPQAVQAAQAAAVGVCVWGILGGVRGFF